MTSYRKRPMIVEAIQLCWRNWGQVCDLLGSVISDQNPGRSVGYYADNCGERNGPYIEITIPGADSGTTQTVKHGEWIVRMPSGEWVVCKPDKFHDIFEVCDGVAAPLAPEPPRSPSPASRRRR